MSKLSEQNTSLDHISVVILSCNRKSELRETLTRLTQPDLTWKEIIIADNDSTDGTQAMLKQEFPAVCLLQLTTNRGVYGINQAFAHASGPWILSLDDDSAPELSTWSPLLAALHTLDNAAAVGLSIVAQQAHNTDTPMRDSSTIDAPEVVPAYGFSQAGCLFNKQALTALGGFDEQLFLWSVELHWTAKALTQGWSIYSCNRASVVHRSTPTNRSSRRHAYYYCRNLMLFILLYCPQDLLPKLLGQFINNALKYSLLHTTWTYLKAIRQARRMLPHAASTKRLSHAQFTAMNPDFKAPFSYLG